MAQLKALQPLSGIAPCSIQGTHGTSQISKLNIVSTEQLLWQQQVATPLVAVSVSRATWRLTIVSGTSCGTRLKLMPAQSWFLRRNLTTVGSCRVVVRWTNTAHSQA